jgi:hypothetical protein
MKEFLKKFLQMLVLYLHLLYVFSFSIVIDAIEDWLNNIEKFNDFK